MVDLESIRKVAGDALDLLDDIRRDHALFISLMEHTEQVELEEQEIAALSLTVDSWRERAGKVIDFIENLNELGEGARVKVDFDAVDLLHYNIRGYKLFLCLIQEAETISLGQEEITSLFSWIFEWTERLKTSSQHIHDFVDAVRGLEKTSQESSCNTPRNLLKVQVN